MLLSGAAEILNVGGRTNFSATVAQNEWAFSPFTPWADQRPSKDRRRRGAILCDNWREHFEHFVKDLGGMKRLCYRSIWIAFARKRRDKLGEAAI